MKISVSFIVKNEEKMLSRALESVKGVDEIVVVDTGSEDKTVEIAKKYTDKVEFFQWCDHFAKARNYSLSKCTGDWVLIVDADEYLDSTIEEVRTAISKAEEHEAVFVNCKVVAERGKSINMFPRLFKRVPEVKWEGAAHNYLVDTSGKRRAVNANIKITYGYSPAHKKDPDRTLRILKGACEKDASLVRERYYLAREYYYRKEYDQCIMHLELYLTKSSFKGERADAYLMMARSYWYSQRGEEARSACLQAIGINPNFREALLLMADMYYEPNKARWLSFADLADNTGVLFNRAPHQEYIVGEDMKLKDYDSTKR